MLRMPRSHPSPSTVLASLALLVALGGTSFAAVSALPQNSVGTLQLKNNAVVSAKVKNGSLLAADFAAGQLQAGQAGQQGPAGAQGPAGPAGPSDAFARFRDGPVGIPFTTKAGLLHLALDAGRYVVVGKIWLENTAGAGASNVECDLTLGGQFDRGRVGLDDQGVGPVKHGMIALTVVGELGSAGGADLNCANFGGGSTTGRFLKITAIKVAALTNTAQ